MTDITNEHFRRCCVATPAVVADAMVRAIGDGPELRWLEPCVGGGAIVKAMRRSGVERERIRGVDLNSAPDVADELADVLRGVEFLTWASATTERFDRIVANPPYIPLVRAPKPARDAALQLRFRGIAFDRRANCWAAFLLASIRLLRDGGSLVFLLPAAWEYAGYARALRRRIGHWFSSVSVIRSREPMCDNVSDANVVVVASGFRHGPKALQHIEVTDADAAVAAMFEATPLGLPRKVPRARATGVTLGDILKIRIGTVAGDAQVFMLTDKQRRDFHLPETALRPVVTRARHVMSPWITRREWLNLRNDGERIWLFAPSDTDLEDPGVSSYIERSSVLVKRDGYKLSRRRHWYEVPEAPPADVFLSGMSKVGPVMCLRRMKDLSATNTLYVGEFKVVTALEDRAGWALSFLSTTTRRALARVARRYPDGLLKIEPGDLMRVKLRTPCSNDQALETYKLALETLHSDGIVAAARVADAWLARD